MAMGDMRTDAVTGVVPPESAEAKIAERWPSVARFPGLARLGSKMQQTIILAPFAWLMLAPLFFLKILPFAATRYTLTNRRIMIRKGLNPKPAGEVKIEDIHEVRVAPGTEQPFYRAADLEIVTDGKVALVLKGVPEYQSFKINIEDTYLAWGRKSPPKEQKQAASALK